MKDRRSIFVLLLAAAVAGVLLAASSGHAEPYGVVSGSASVIDASHLEIAGQRFKLYGIDAPDPDETCQDAKGQEYPCGLDARDALAALVKNASVSCLPRGPNQLNETMGACSVGKQDVAKALVEGGWAIADRPRTLYYEDTEVAARTAKRGLWQGHFVPPEDWRNGERVPQGGGAKGALGQGVF